MSELDNIFFNLSSRGLFSRSLQEATDRVKQCSYSTKKKTCLRFLRWSFFATIPIAGLLALFFFADKSATLNVEGTLALRLEHGAANECSACGGQSVRDQFDYTAEEIGQEEPTDTDKCVPFPREPLIFQGTEDGPEARVQLGLYMNATHLSLRVSDNGIYFPKDVEKDKRCQQIFGTGGGANELLVLVRDTALTKRDDQTRLDFAVLLDRDQDVFGEVVDSGSAECFFTATIKKKNCDGSEVGALRQAYDDSSYQESTLKRAWIIFDLKVFADVIA